MVIYVTKKSVQFTFDPISRNVLLNIISKLNHDYRFINVITFQLETYLKIKINKSLL
jgi:hypothetical protein